MRQNTGRFDSLLLVGALLIVFYLSGPLLTIPLHIPLSYNEGWNAYFDQRAIGAGAGPLYPSADSLVFNNYPPLSFYLVGAFGRYVLGDMIVAGRLVAIGSLLVSAALLGVCVKLLNGSLRGSLVASGLLLLYSSTFFRDYVAMDDPQWMAHALMLGGLAVLLRGYATARYPVARVAVAALLVAAGGLVKHNLVGLPLAVTIWLALMRPRVAMVWLAAAVGWVGMGLVVTAILHGQAAFKDILAHPRVFRITRLNKAVERLIPLLPMMLIAGLVCRRRLDDDPPMRFATLFVAISLVTGIAQRFGEGIYYNAHFETMLALCLLTGLTVSRTFAGKLRLRGRAIGPAALVGFAAIPVLVMMPWQLKRALADLDDRAARARSWQPIIARIAASPGIAGCESLSLCFWAGKPFAVDLFNLDQSILTGGSIARFDGLARTHAFTVFEYSGDSFTVTDAVGTPRRDPLLMDLLGHGYASVAAGPGGTMLLAPADMKIGNSREACGYDRSECNRTP